MNLKKFFAENYKSRITYMIIDKNNELLFSIKSTATKDQCLLRYGSSEVIKDGSRDNMTVITIQK